MVKYDFIPDVNIEISQPSHYYDANNLLERVSEGDVHYEEAIVTFIDILGFKSLVEFASASKIADILSMFQYVSQAHTTASIITEDYENVRKTPQVIYFSDSLVRIAYPMNFHGESHANDSLNKTIDIGFETGDIAHFQRLLLLSGVLIRGAITRGKIYSNKKSGLLFGPAMNRAYYIESNLSKHPRIIVDPEIIQTTSKKINSLICEDEDGLVYINYFNFPAFNERGFCMTVEYGKDSELFDEYSIMQFEMFEKRKEIIKQGLRNNSSDSGVLKKYNWLAKKHNDSVTYFFDTYREQSDYLKLSGTPKKESEYYC